MAFYLGPINSYIDIASHMGYDYNFAENIICNHVRTKKGQLYSYLHPSTFTKYTIPITWVNSEYRSLINSWWKSKTSLYFYDDFQAGTEWDSEIEWDTEIEWDSEPSNSMRIVNIQEPMQNFIKPYFRIYYQGKIVLETI